MPHLPFPAHDETLDGQRLGAHRSVGVQARGRDADLGAEAELATIGEPRRRVVHHRRLADLAKEAFGRPLIAGDDRLGVIAAPALDVRDGRVEAVDDAHRDD